MAENRCLYSSLQPAHPPVLRWLIVLSLLCLAGCSAFQPVATLAPGEVPRAAAPVVYMTVTTAPTALVTAASNPTATATAAPPTPIAPATVTSSPTATATAAPPTPTTAAAAALPDLVPTPDKVARQARVPILMYHYLSDSPEGANKYRRDLSVSPSLFAGHLAYLQAQGYQSISLYDLVAHLTQGAPLPPKPVIITFDDGYRDNYENAFPLLQQYGFQATFFVLTEVTYMGEPEYLTWEQMRAMQAGGMDIECHARVHEDLVDDDDARLVWQVLGCREAIESELGRRPRFTAYPSGVFDDRVAAFFASDNYWGAVTTQQGALHSTDALFQLKRLRVRGSTTIERLATLLDFQELP